MIVFYPPDAEPRTHKIGRTVFHVHAFFCGYGSIYHKLAELMEDDLLSEDTLQSIDNTTKIVIDKDER